MEMEVEIKMDNNLLNVNNTWGFIFEKSRV